ncbi:hypothetical protein GIW05_00215 [Pseudomonas syringae]|uniref:hypothetical protein n=1 Tax=Pseudomonas syringae TaxID=317 RepID=UPI001F321E24|nr:hypothetical protein [Pseudomonas syringae]MCF5381945.1 hypothetical protein [Pseudomonas syringae]MCF5423801.1 hypothetical protein [Pseudomonas syringae]MCF5454737.1 hypothetical protein [Pseudomonas syringae]MCF5459570.1 hypothetical protein [Pseudomonas syringae]
MTDKKTTLGNLAGKLTAGLSRINDEAKRKAEGKPSTPQADEQHIIDDDNLIQDHENVSAPTPKTATQDRLTAKDDDIDDALIIDSEIDEQQPKRKSGMSTKQKLLLIACAALAIFWFTKIRVHAPSPAELAASEVQIIGDDTPGTEKAADIASPPFEFGADKPAQHQPVVTESKSGVDLGFGNAPTVDPANAPIGGDVLTADLNDQFSSLSEDTTETLDPFSGAVTQTPPLAVAQPVNSLAKAPISTPVGKAGEISPQESGNPAPLQAPSDNAFKADGSNSTELGGTGFQNADSSKGVLQDQTAKADVGKLKANLAEKDVRISKLETENGKLKTQLSDAEKDLANAQSKGKTPSKGSQHKPVKTAQTPKPAKPSTSTQRVANAPKPTPRPQLCVTALAQAARNCTTCVAHAFISHKGNMSMVGQGDYIEGLRVNIVGDRLDLQNAQGDVVHKYWSSPNGCDG